MYDLRLGADDIARVRFAVSPLWEVCHAVRSLVDPRQRPYHLPWLDAVRDEIETLDVLPLLTIQPLRGYTPDLIAPIPEHPRTTVHEQLDRLRATPLAHVRDELHRALTERDGQPVPEEMRSLARNPRGARTRIADALEACWERLIAPYWPRINDLLTADIAHHSRLLADNGLERLFPALSPRLSWTGTTLRADTGMRPAQTRSMTGEGLLLQPSAFSWPSLIVISESAISRPSSIPPGVSQNCGSRSRRGRRLNSHGCSA